MTPEKAKAIWAIYVWCRRTDELVDGPNAPRMTPAALDRWEDRLDAVFCGRPYDVLDAALTDTVARFAVDPQPFRDMVGAGLLWGQRGAGRRPVAAGPRFRGRRCTTKVLVSFGGQLIPTTQTMWRHTFSPPIC